MLAGLAAAALTVVRAHFIMPVNTVPDLQTYMRNGAFLS